MCRYSARALVELSRSLLQGFGLAERHADPTARNLVEADLLGHHTHGVDLLPLYVSALENGDMAKDGNPDVLRDTGSNLLWDGKHLPGQSLIEAAAEVALDRFAEHGIVTISIQRSHHTGGLASYLQRFTDRGALVVMMAANTTARRIAPHGGTTPVFSPSPFAVGIPTGDEPLLLDMTMASTANSVVRQHYRRNEPLQHTWLLDAAGQPSKEPAVLYEEPKGTILPLGGVDNGHKGFGLILFLEALTLALSGNGHGGPRSERPSQSVFLQVFDPDAFGGASHFKDEIAWIVDRCRASSPVPGGGPPRLPGERSLERKRRQLHEGVEVASDVRLRVEECAARVGLTFPPPY